MALFFTFWSTVIPSPPPPLLHPDGDPQSGFHKWPQASSSLAFWRPFLVLLEARCASSCTSCRTERPIRNIKIGHACMMITFFFYVIVPTQLSYSGSLHNKIFRGKKFHIRQYRLVDYLLTVCVCVSLSRHESWCNSNRTSLALCRGFAVVKDPL